MGCDSCTWTVNGKVYACYIYTTNIHKWIQNSFKKKLKKEYDLNSRNSSAITTKIDKLG
jgi:hypothetical protein